MFFEGSEKKVDVVINDPEVSLINDLSDDFWAELVSCSKAKIISKIENDECKAFLLSESSLFVWHNRFIILTCGVTNLVNSVEFFIQKMGAKSIGYLTYQRKNEYFSQAQPSCFGDDVKLLNQYVKGNALRFGELDEHHAFLFYQQGQYQRITTDKTYEFVAYQISQEASNKLTTPNLDAEDIRSFLTIDSLLPGFLLDDHVFEPYGYSINAILEDKYLTIHVTPQAESSYVSFESNMNLIEIIPNLLNVLEPKSFDLLCFNDHEFKAEIIGIISKNHHGHYVGKSLVENTLTNGCTVYFANFILPQAEYRDATEFDVSLEHHEL